MAPLTRKSSKEKVPISASSIIRGRRKMNKNSTASSVSRSSAAEAAAAPEKTSTEKTDEVLEPATTNTVDFDSAAEVSNLISTSNIFGSETTQRISKLQLNTPKYTTSLSGAVTHFFAILAKHPSIHHLADTIQDPSASEGTMEYRLVFLVRGVKTQDKYNILNTSLLVAGMNLKLMKYDDVDITER